jgi:hypothetical protein
MPRPCSVCGHPKRREIDESLRRGDKPNAIARAHAPLTDDAVRRHLAAKHHEATAAPGRTSAPVAPTGDKQKAPRLHLVGGSESPVTRSRKEPRNREPAPELIPAEAPVDRDGRVKHCMAVMAANMWENGETGKVLAAAWGMSPSTLADIAAEASRRLRSATDDKQIGSMVAVALSRGLEAAVSMVEAGDAKALSGLASLAKVYLDSRAKDASASHAASGRPVITIQYAEGVPPMPNADPLQPAAEPGAPSPPVRQ